MDDLDINSLSLWSETALKSFLQARNKLTPNHIIINYSKSTAKGKNKINVHLDNV